MKLSKSNCPTCGEVVRGTLERLTGVAEIGADKSGHLIYTGTTDIWWDEQKTVRTVRNGKSQVILVCYQGHDWPSEMEEEEAPAPEEEVRHGR